MLKLLIFLIFLGSCSKNYTSSGKIETDEIWKGKIKLKGDVIVEELATLKILEGSRITYSKKSNFNTHYIKSSPIGNVDVLQDDRIEIIVKGVLKVIGKDGKEVIFEGKKQAGGIVFLSDKKGSIIRFAKFFKTGVAIRCYGESNPVIENVYIKGSELGGIGLWDTSKPVIKKVEIEDSLHGIGVSDFSEPEISSCVIMGIKKAGIFTEGDSKARVFSNKVTGCNVGIAIGDISKPEIFKNSISGCGAGISMWVNAEPRIYENKIFKNITGIVIQEEAKPYIFKNEFFENGGGIGANDGAEPVIEENRFFSNPKSIIASGGSILRVFRNIISSSKVGIFVDSTARVYLKDNKFYNVIEKTKVLNKAKIIEKLSFLFIITVGLKRQKKFMIKFLLIKQRI